MVCARSRIAAAVVCVIVAAPIAASATGMPSAPPPPGFVLESREQPPGGTFRLTQITCDAPEAALVLASDDVVISADMDLVGFAIGTVDLVANTGSLVVPQDQAPGDYQLLLLCGGTVEGAGVTVTGAVAAVPVDGQPSFTG
jgi:hypothetical protein